MNLDEFERHSHTASWVDPEVTRTMIDELRADGDVDAVRGAMLRGDLPLMPAWEWAGVRPVITEDGTGVCELNPAEHHCHGGGAIQGGVLCILIDAAMVRAVLGAGTGVGPTLELKVNYIRPIPTTIGPIRCVAEVEYAGRQTAVLHARVVDRTGRLYATASATWIFPAGGVDALRERLARLAQPEPVAGD